MIRRMLDRRFYPETESNWDDIRFSKLVRTHLASESKLLDFGCGRGRNNLLDFRNECSHVVGADVDPDVQHNSIVDEACLLTPGKTMPFEDEAFDIVISCNVLEHLEEPVSQFSEVARVLKPGGKFIAKTTNARHYVPLVARCSPHWFHEWVNHKRGREVCDTFPTFYRCNSERTILQLAGLSSMVLEEIYFWEWRPEYLRFSWATYLPGILYERVVNRWVLLRRFRAVLCVVLKKQ